MASSVAGRRVLFTGITGLLGKYFIQRCMKDYEIIGVANSNSISTLDKVQIVHTNIVDKQSVTELIESVKPSVVVHAASIGKVDYCESHPEEAYEVNVIGTKNIVQACKKLKAKIIFTSTNAVYDGEHPPFNEQSAVSPIDVYGKTKVEAENIVRNCENPFTIVRLMTMYGWQYPFGRNNPVTWIIEQLEKQKSVHVVNDIYNNHLWAGQAAEVLWKIIMRDQYNEIYNVAGNECITRYELTLKVASVFGLDASFISPVPSSYFTNVAPRPKNTCFDTQKISRDFRMTPYSIVEGLEKMREERTYD